MTSTSSPDTIPQHAASVVISRAIVIWYVVTLAALTVLTHGSQLASAAFSLYAVLSGAVTALTTLVAAWQTAKSMKTCESFDLLPLAIVLLAGVISGMIVLYSQPYIVFGQAGNDDYYYLANPAFYMQHPAQALSFAIHDYYSGQVPFHSVSMFTGGAYQYMQAALAYLFHIDFLKFVYWVASPTTAFMFPVALYLLLQKLTGRALDSAISSLLTLPLLALLAESPRTPASWIFAHVLQGKSTLASAGILLLVYFSLEYFETQRSAAWLCLATTVITLVGMTTTAIMVIPAVYGVLFLDYSFLVKPVRSFVHLLVGGLQYGASLIYVLLFAGYVWFTDTHGLASYANQGYPQTLGKFVGYFFAGAQVWLSLVFYIVFALLALLLTSGWVRRFLLGLIVLPFLILNPWVSAILIPLFPGIYFRMFYILPLFLVMGIVLVVLLQRSQQWKTPVRLVAWSASAAILGVSILISPTSAAIYINTPTVRLYGSETIALARRLINRTPPGLMLAPYPISYTVFIRDSDRPQMYVRPDISDTFLWSQGREAESVLRAHAANFLDPAAPGESNSADYQAFTELIRRYPEIRVVVLRDTQASIRDARAFLHDNGFRHYTVIDNWVAFWR